MAQDVTAEFNTNDLVKIANMKMPYGKYKGLNLIDLPERYVVWYHSKGFPDGELGRLLRQLYEIKLNGLEYLFKPLRGVNIVKSKPKKKITPRISFDKIKNSDKA